MIIFTTADDWGRRGIKSAIVKLLSKEWPLSLKALHYLISRKYALNVSYQAVHKAAKELLQNSVIDKNGRRYCLNKQWILRIKTFGTETELAYSKASTNQNEFESVASLLSGKN